jgi:hypothetical protein
MTQQTHVEAVYLIMNESRPGVAPEPQKAARKGCFSSLKSKGERIK